MAAENWVLTLRTSIAPVCNVSAAFSMGVKADVTVIFAGIRERCRDPDLEPARCIRGQSAEAAARHDCHWSIAGFCAIIPAASGYLFHALAEIIPAVMERHS